MSYQDEVNALKTIIQSKELELNKKSAIIAQERKSAISRIDENRRVVKQLAETQERLERLNQETIEIERSADAREQVILFNLSKLQRDKEVEIERLTQEKHLTVEEKEAEISRICDEMEAKRKEYDERVRKIRSELMEKQIELEEQQMIVRGTNWDQWNINTINTWIKECNKQEYIYDDVLEKIKDRSNLVKLVLLVLSTITMLLTTSGLSLSESTNTYVLWTYKISIAVLAAIAYGLTSYQKLANFEDMIEDYSRYTDKIGNFLSNVTSTSEMKVGLRPDGDKYVIDNRKVYSDIYRESPYMKQSYWKVGLKSYNNYLHNIDTEKNYCARKRNNFKQYLEIENDSEDILCESEPLLERKTKSRQWFGQGCNKKGSDKKSKPNKLNDSGPENPDEMISSISHSHVVNIHDSVTEVPVDTGSLPENLKNALGGGDDTV